MRNPFARGPLGPVPRPAGMPSHGPADSRPWFVLFPFGGAAKELRVMVEVFPPVPLAIGSLARPLPRHPG